MLPKSGGTAYLLLRPEGRLVAGRYSRGFPFGSEIGQYVVAGRPGQIAVVFYGFISLAPLRLVLADFSCQKQVLKRMPQKCKQWLLKLPVKGERT